MDIKNYHADLYKGYVAFSEDKIYILKAYGLVKKLYEKGALKPGDVSLDLGCADGSLSSKIQKDFGLTTYGLDISEGAIELANQKGVIAAVHDLEKPFPFEDEKFDLVIASEIIEHLFDTDEFIRQLKRVLKPGGYLIVTTPNLVSLVNRIKILFGEYPEFVPEYRNVGAGHIRAYTPKTLKSHLKDYGFNVQRVVSPNITFPINNPFIPRFLKKLAMRLGDFFPNIGSHTILLSNKGSN